MMRFIFALIVAGLVGAPNATTATPVSPSAASAATPILMSLAASEASGMQPDGALFAAQFLEGQTLEQAITLQGGRCYAIIAVGVSVSQVDVQLVSRGSPMLPTTVIAESNHGSPAAVIGGRNTGCVKTPASVNGPATVIVKATRGAGLIAAQVFVK